MSFTDFLKDSGTVQRKTEGAVDAGGHPALTWASAATVAGRLEEGAAMERLRDGELVVTEARWWMMSGQVSPDVDEEDRLVVDGVTWEIVGVAAVPGRRAVHHLVFDLRKVA